MPTAEAVALTVAYSDLFGHAPTVAEVLRLLIGASASAAQVQAALAGPATEWVAQEGGRCYLHGRRDLIAEQPAREAAARRLWQAAGRYLNLVSALPFVRMAAVTGSLAMSAVGRQDDVDLLVVATSGRLWLCRGFLVALARWSRRAGPLLCPNFLLTTRRLEIPDRNLFTARELFQMVPMVGYPIYRQMLRQNAWAVDFLPNAQPRPEAPRLPRARALGRLQPPLERVLSGRLGQRLERWEMERKVRKLGARQPAGRPAVEFGPDVCRGHFDRYDLRTLRAFAELRLRLGLPEPAGAGWAPDPR
jgi:hypothetical protein